MKSTFVVSAFALLYLSSAASADDWPMFGRDKTRNSVSPEKNPPVDWDVKTGRNIKWKAELGTQSHGLVAVSGGLVWVGTNNLNPRDPAVTGDAGVLMCFRESDGKFLYQHVSRRLRNRRQNDWPESPIANTPLIEGDRLWFTTTRCEAVCLDIGPLLKGTGPAKEVWKLDMVGDLGVHPHAAVMLGPRTCSIAGYRDFVYVVTGNGVDETHVRKPAPLAPSLVCLNRNTGKVVWTDNSPGEEILHGQWGAPLVAEIGGRAQCIAPQGDGWLRSFDALTGKLLWKCDTNSKNAEFRPGGGNRNELLTAPVLYQGRVYVANGQDHEHGEGEGVLYCIDPTKDGDISAELDDGPLPANPKRKPDDDDGPVPQFGQPRKGKPNPNSGVIWSFGKRGKKPEDNMHRTISTVAVHNGLVIAPDLSGFIHCLDAKTGERYWVHDAMTETWGTPLIADGKVYIGNWDGDVLIFELSKQKRLLAKHTFGSWVPGPPVFSNGVLYVAGWRLYAIGGPGAEKLPAGVPKEKPAGGAERNGLRAPYSPTPPEVVAKMLEMAGVKKGDVVWDLGSGDGRIPIAAAKTYGVKAAGFEIDGELVKTSVENARKAGVESLTTFKQADVFTLDLSEATVVTLYLLPDMNVRLIPQLEKLKPGSRIVSHMWDMKGVKPDQVVKFRPPDGSADHILYLWTTPLKKEKP